jgi:hypothetical protein
MVGLGRAYKNSGSSSAGVKSPRVDDDDVGESRESDGENGEP